MPLTNYMDDLYNIDISITDLSENITDKLYEDDFLKEDESINNQFEIIWNSSQNNISSSHLSSVANDLSNISLSSELQNSVERLNQSYDENEELKNEFMKTKQQKINELNQDKYTLDTKYNEYIRKSNYIFFIVWCFIFILLVIIFIFYLIEENPKIHLFTKFILLVVFIFIIFKSYKNIAKIFNN